MSILANPVVFALVLIAIASVFIFISRLVELRRAHIDWKDFVHGVTNVLESGTEAEALAICDDTGVPVSAVVSTAIRNRHGSARMLREAVDSTGRAETGRLDRRLAVLAIVGQVAPALGLFGTIIGFIDTVALVNSQAVVSRIALMSLAMRSLVAAAVGLAVAIAATVMYGMLRTRMERIVLEMEAAASSVLGYIATEEAKR